jgi:uncharacterized lipoprotein YbaY
MLEGSPLKGPQTVTGKVLLTSPAGSGAVLHVKIEDTSRADAAARVVAEAVMPITRSVAVGEEIPFNLTIPDADERAHYGVQIHVDTTGSGDVTEGDLVSTEAQPVIT